MPDDNPKWREKLATYFKNDVFLSSLTDDECETLYQTLSPIPAHWFGLRRQWQVDALLGKPLHENFARECDRRNRTVAFYSALGGHLNNLERIRQEAPKLLSRTDLLGFTVGHAAAFGGSVEVLDWVNEHVSYALRGVSSDGYTIAHAAAMGGSVEALRWTEEHTPDHFNMDMMKGGSIAHVAAMLGNIDILIWLQETHPDFLDKTIQEGGNRGATVAAYSFLAGNDATRDWLWREKPELFKSTDAKGETVVTYAMIAPPGCESLFWLERHYPEVFDKPSVWNIIRLALSPKSYGGFMWVIEHLPDIAFTGRVASRAYELTRKNVVEPFITMVSQYKAAQEHLEQKAFAEAIGAFDQVLAYNPACIGAYLCRGFAKLKLPERDETGLDDLRIAFDIIQRNQYGERSALFYLSHLSKDDLLWCIKQLPPAEQKPVLKACLDRTTALGKACLVPTTSAEYYLGSWTPSVIREYIQNTFSFDERNDLLGVATLEDKGEDELGIPLNPLAPTSEEERMLIANNAAVKHYNNAETAHVQEAIQGLTQHLADNPQALALTRELQALFLNYLKREYHDAQDLQEITTQITRIKEETPAASVSSLNLFSEDSAWDKFKAAEEDTFKSEKDNDDELPADESAGPRKP